MRKTLSLNWRNLAVGCALWVPVIAFGLVVILALSGCGSLANNARQRYVLIEGSGSATESELCREARAVADAYADEGDGEQFLDWRATANVHCVAAQLGVVMVSPVTGERGLGAP